MIADVNANKRHHLDCHFNYHLKCPYFKKLFPQTSGKSAYELALDNGFVGTIQEWLDSLKAHIEPDYKNIKEVCDLTNNTSYIADTKEYMQWESEITNATNWARYILTVDGTIVYQTTKAGLLATGTYINITIPIMINVGSVVTASIGFSSGGNIERNILKHIPLL